MNQEKIDRINELYRKSKAEGLTEEEKTAYPTHETTGGYLKVLDESECAQLWWDGLPDYKKDTIRDLPNFDSEIFKQCTGITIK